MAMLASKAVERYFDDDANCVGDMVDNSRCSRCRERRGGGGRGGEGRGGGGQVKLTVGKKARVKGELNARATLGGGGWC